MKHLYLLTFLLFSIIGFAQIPTGYYNSATGTGYTLKSNLKRIIDANNDGLATEYVHNPQSYNSMDPFIASNDLDTYYENNNTILDIYSENPAGTDPYNFTPVTDECGNYNAEGDCYNKEHVIPKSIFNDAMPMYGDGHNLLPTDGRVNGFRSNFPFGRVNDSQLASQSGITNPTLNGSKLGNNLNSGYSAGYSSTVFEPIDEFKGDIARIYFYFVTRYEDNIASWNAYPMFDGSSTKAIADPFLNILMTWHQNDPVSQKEIDRNNDLFVHQNNRNPFIDHPEYVTLIWSGTPDTEAPSNPTNLVASNPTDTSIALTWTASTDNVAVASYDIYKDDVLEINTNSTSYTVIGLTPETNYCFKVKAKDNSGNESNFSNTACETTTNNGSSSVDLFFSEYMEGGSNNKALEIANFTGNSVDLSIYTLKLSSNGSATWTATYSFPTSSSISNEDVYVIGNGSLAVCTGVVDNQNNTITGFNGNDAVGLFKNDILIDIIGTLGDATTFAQNVTLVRKPEIAGPSTTFDINEWNSFPQDTCTDLGMHTQTLSVDETTNSTISFFPNPVKDNLNIKTIRPTSTTIEIYNILGKRVLISSFQRETTIDVSSFKNGVYIVKLAQGNNVLTKKLVKQ